MIPNDLPFFETPQRRVADAGLFRQPIERSPLHGQQFIYSNFNHMECRSASVSIYYVRDIARVKYILHLTYSIVQLERRLGRT